MTSSPRTRAVPPKDGSPFVPTATVRRLLATDRGLALLAGLVALAWAAGLGLLWS